ncbi:MAG: FAD-dependent oxidoreductase [Planctomycetota bacterium]|jgi:heterodisulfide reductase subunit A
MADAKGNGTVGAVLVVGGGIGGIQASLDLADSGYKVYLLDKLPSIGGLMARLDKTFPTNDCSMCIMAPKLVAAGRHSNVELVMNSDVLELEGEPGDFRVKVGRRPLYVDTEKCTGCGVCAEHCPVEAVDAYNAGMDRRGGIYVGYQQAVPLVYGIDRDACIGCGLCAEYCEAKAVCYEDEETARELAVGSVVLAPGCEVFDAELKPELGYGRFPNVVSCIEFERILSASGPYRGLVLRPSDGDEPHKVAFIQCVGSRDARVGKDYCSAACCMYATKEAVIAKEHLKSLEPAIFYMDMRSYGKDFDKYIERAKSEYGVRFIRSRVASVQEVENHDLEIAYEDESGKLSREKFNMVVLSSGLSSPASAQEMAKRLGVELNEHGFARTSEFAPLSTSRPGVFVAGAFQGPKDIPETVTQCSAAAAEAAGLLSDARGELVTEKEYPPDIDVRGAAPRIGCFICHCGINIGGYVDVPAITEYAMTLPNVVYAERNLFTCSQDTQEKMKAVIEEHKLTRVIVASCTPRTHEPLFQETCAEAGLNRYLFEMANIRDQCSWVHMNEPEAGTEKAKILVRMAVAKASKLTPLENLKFDLTKRALVVGGGLSGMTAALGIAEQGYEVALVEREGELGGHMRHIHFTLSGEDPQKLLAELVEKVESNEFVRVFKNAKVKQLDGYVGNYKTVIATGELEEECQEEFEHGVVIVCTGADEHEPKDFGYGTDERVMKQSDLEGKIASGAPGVADAKNVVMIQCVGSRDEERPYCSRFCCSQAVKNALEIKKRDPDANVYVLYRDMRTYGFRETAFRRAREAGVVFVRFDPEDPPKVAKQGDALEVEVLDKVLGERLAVPADIVALAAATVAREDSDVLAQMLKVPLNAEGFFLEAHMKLRPVDFATDGVFMAGLSHAPKFMEESIVQAKAAVARACTVLAKDAVEAEGKIAAVDKTKCAACGLCESVCAYGAIEVTDHEVRSGVERYADVTGALCKGCGTCASSCRCGAVDVQGFTNAQILAAALAS